MEMNYIILKKLELGDLPLENVAVGCTDGSAFTQMRGSRPSGLLEPTFSNGSSSPLISASAKLSLPILIT